jgi:hypothetical protein
MHAPPELRLYSAAEVDAGAGRGPMRTILDWCRTFLVSPHPDLGRTGPVCPYTSSSLRRDLLYLATLAQATDIAGIAATVGDVRRRYRRMADALPPDDAELLTFLVLLPDFDPADSSPLDALQRRVKDEYVTEGLMIGQFHPACDNPGLWNEGFRPLRAPIPLLAIRRMLVFDLPFLVEASHHLDAWLERFAPQLPPRVRTHLTARVLPVQGAPAAGA